MTVSARHAVGFKTIGQVLCPRNFSFIHLFISFLLHACYVSDTAVGVGDSAVDKMDKVPTLVEHMF